MSQSTLPGSGRAVEVEVGFRNLTDVELSGDLLLRVEGLAAPWTAPVTLGPHGHDRESYQRGDEIQVEFEVRNEGEAGGELPYRLAVGSLWAGEGRLALAPGGTGVVSRRVAVPADLERGGRAMIRFETWRASAAKSVSIEVPGLSLRPVFQALQTGVEVTGVVGQSDSLPIEASLVCRLWGPAGSLPEVGLGRR